MRRLYHVARADFLQRVRSRGILVVLAVIAYVGYLVNVGQIELAYQVGSGDSLTNFHGAQTAGYIGLKAGLTGSAVLLFVGFYLMKDTLSRDRANNVDEMVASTPVSDRTYLLGKWLSNVMLGGVIVATLGFATIANHAVHGVGPTDPVALLFPLFVLALPVAALVGAVSLLFETIDRLNGTLGNISYLLVATFALVGVSASQGALPSEIPRWAKATDVLGHLVIYELTVDALLTEVPDYAGGAPSIGTLEGDRTFRWNGGAWPLWVYFQRTGLIISAIAVVLVATIPFDRVYRGVSSESPGRISQLVGLLPGVGQSDDTVGNAAEPPSVDSISLTPVENRNAGGIRRLLLAEFRLAVRDMPWWWYVGAVVLVAAPLVTLVNSGPANVSVEPFRQVFLPLVFVWPIFVWSDMGVRTVKHRLTELVISSGYPVRQLVAEWLAGVAVAVTIGSGVLALCLSVGQTGIVLGFVSGALFAPSFALAAGIWSRSSWLFEVLYLGLWYVGPLNGAVPLDFVGSSVSSTREGVPFIFIGLSVVLFGVAIARRKLEVG